MNHEGLRKRVDRLEEEAIGVSEFDTVIWSASDGGIFGHAHIRFNKNLMKQEIVPCSDEEEIEIMRQHFEIDKHRPWDKGQYVPFWKYLEEFSYLAP